MKFTEDLQKENDLLREQLELASALRESKSEIDQRDQKTPILTDQIRYLLQPIYCNGRKT